jgi:HSP20 family protein
MTILRFDPFQEFDRLTQQMLGSGRAPRSMPMEAYRRGDQFFIHLDLPGIGPDDVQLTVERNVVAVRAERRPFWQEGDEVLVDETPRAPSAASCSSGTTWTPAGWRPASTRAS